MKNNKLRITLVCVVLACISVFFASCAQDKYNTNLDMKGEAMPYEIASTKALPSCAFITVQDVIATRSAIGCFVTDDGYMIVDSAIFPSYSFGLFNEDSITVMVKTESGDMVAYGGGAHPEQVKVVKELTYLHLKLIKVNGGENSRFTPVTIGDSDALKVGESLLAIDYLDYLDSEQDKYMRVFSSNVGSLGFEFGGMNSSLDRYMMTLSGNFNPIDAADNVGITNGDLAMRSASAVVFNSKGEMVGYNKYKLVNNGQENPYITHGIGYAVESNAIKSALEAQEVL